MPPPICVLTLHPLQRRTHLPADKAIPAPPGGVFRPYQFITANTDLARGDYPVEATMLNVVTGETVVVYSKYLIGCDGARSGVRKAIAGGGEKDGNTTGKIQMVGEMSDISTFLSALAVLGGAE